MLVQQLVNGVSLGAIYAVFAIGFTLVFGVMNVLNLSQGAVFMWGAYVGLEVVRTLALPLPLAILAAATAAGLLGVLSEVLVFRPLQRRGAHRWMGMVGGLALARILIGLAQEMFGTQVVRYPDNTLAGAALELLGARLQLLQIVAIGVAFMMVTVLAALLRYTNLGRAIRTVAFSEGRGSSRWCAGGSHQADNIFRIWRVGRRRRRVVVAAVPVGLAVHGRQHSP